MKPFLNIAIQAARSGGNVILRHIDQLYRVKVNEKACNDFVTDVDYKSEAAIVSVIQKAYPDHAIWAEEGGKTQSDSSTDYEWIIDPLDGTTNFIHGIPHVCVSIGLRHKARLICGVVYDPLREELFTAVRGEGALLNGRRIRVSDHTSLKSALVGTGFPSHNRNVEQGVRVLQGLLTRSASFRRCGAAALDLAYVAMGRLDAFWEFGLKPWDIAAGILLVTEAGGLLTDCAGGETYFDSGNVLAGTPRVFKSLLQLLNE